MSVAPSRSLLIAFRRALALEIRHGYSNMQGQRQTFAAFAREQSRALLEKLAAADKTPGHLLTHTCVDYEELDVRQRHVRLLEAERLLDSIERVLPAERLVRQSGTTWSDVGIQYVKGVGPKLAESFAKAKLFTVGDLLRHYPRKHLDYAQQVPIARLEPGTTATILGQVVRTECFASPRNPNLTILSITVRDQSGTLKASWFHGKANKYLQEQYKRRFPLGATVVLSGLVKQDSYSGKVLLDRPDAEILGDAEDGSDSLHVGRIVPIYPLTEGLGLKTLRRTMHTALETYGPEIEDPLPPRLKSQHQLIELGAALRQFHFPATQDEVTAARRRLVFDELLELQLALQLKRQQRNQGTALQGAGRGPLVLAFLKALPFALTKAQQRVVDEVIGDLSSPHAMNRLIQGDVGSGKTVVAIIALLAAIQAKTQGALMVPTEILAEQHFRKIKPWLEPLGLRVALLLGSMRRVQRREIIGELALGTIDLVIGTHALIVDDVQFRHLGLVVIDEQHRFGVKQRALLRSKGQHPEILSMTATPIPRTLALALHGDLDVSTIDELPPGRLPVETEVVTGRGRRKVEAAVRAEVTRGGQAYVVFPLIEESEKLDVRAATEEAERLANDVYPEFTLGLLHGQMDSAAKEAVMRRFVAGDVQILVSTTVIEVGVDVPNATIMVIENAERFGLAQLHQLRGGVGRGADRSYCYLLADKLSEVGKQRLGIMAQTNDGFIIAEQDLRLRGPGEFLGVRQSGLPDLILADLVNDTATLEAARAAALSLINEDPELTQYPSLRRAVQRFDRDGELDFLAAG
ncbi:MAG: ATP-dependent DNA helicase RecG [Candidatus Sericytochromatia bacterium]|nr:ATP-dependent DNA helicase RecG [Candidatus Sericytochromatia bacterium]